MQLTYFGSNSWFLEVGRVRILLDPWLVDSLTFGGQRWFFEAVNNYKAPTPKRVDLILLSQGLPDHAHRPTLEQLDRAIPVVGSVSAAKVATELGYLEVTALKPGEMVDFGNRLQIRALAGAPVPQVENGYLLTQLRDDRKLYYEPHGYVDPVLADLGPIDVVMSPLMDMMLPLSIPVIQGKKTAFGLVEQLQPRYFFSTAAGGDVSFSGVLNRMLKNDGTKEELEAQVAAGGYATEVIDAVPGQPYRLDFKSATSEGTGTTGPLATLNQWVDRAKTASGDLINTAGQSLGLATKS
ncbi:MAG: MBL fold metallo-hydrolase [Prochlorothrix sp.]